MAAATIGADYLIHAFKEVRDSQQTLPADTTADPRQQISYGELLNTPDPEISSVLAPEGDIEAGLVDSSPAGSTDPRSDNFDLHAWMLKRRSVHQKANFVVPEVNLVYKDLASEGDPVVPTYISTVASPILRLFDVRPKMMKVTGKVSEPPNKQILFPMSGFCKPGEMTLVIGRPGAGCSTLLRTLAGITRGLKAVGGEITFNGIRAPTFKEKYSSYLAYCPEDDPHYATLTVRETLRFVLECRVGGTLDERRRKELIEELIEVVIRVLGLRNCVDTKVGSALVRGCSGGERKRVSIAEQMLVGASIGIWDGSTKGLDSSSALDFIRALRIMTNVTRRGNILSLYQASQDMYNLFDKVIVLAEGRCIYFGPASDAQEYFESRGFFCSPRKTTPDFLTGITEVLEREVREGWAGKVATTPQEFEKLYHASGVYRRMREEGECLLQHVQDKRIGEKFAKQVATNKAAFGHAELAESVYNTTAWQQLQACVKREYCLARGNVALLSRVVFDSAMALVVGSTFWQLALDVPGTFARGGILYFSILFNALTALAAVPLVFVGRAVAAKHRSYSLYRTQFQPFAMQLIDLPINTFIIIVWSIAVYWMAGLKHDAGAFFSYILFIFATSQAMGAIVRTVASLTPSIDLATPVNGVMILLFILYSGYIIPHGSMHLWFVWIYWVNPIAYGMKALLENEFVGQIFDCSAAYVPHGAPIYDKGPGVCAVKGGSANSRFFTGEAYLEANMDMNTNWRWINFAVLIVMWVTFLVVMIVANSFVDYSTAGYNTNMYKKRKRRQLIQMPSGQIREAVEPEARNRVQDAALLGMTNLGRAADFTWKHIRYAVPIKNDMLQLLDDVNGFVRPGSMTALMGSSGAGKTTLIDAITQRKTIGDLSGHVYVGKNPQGKDFKMITAYCEQLDIHNPFCTVREALRFSALLRQPVDVPLEEKHAFVETVIELLELGAIADAVIGKPFSAVGLSMEQRKRVTIGVELVARPKIMFLDEPTSGLDSQAAFTIVRLLRTLARSGQSVVCTIHQPSAVLFEMFDNLLLLARGGKTVYFGLIGKNSKTVIEYFESHGAPKCSSKANVAEYILDSTGAGTSPNVKQDWPEIWKNSPENKRLLEEIDEIRGVTDDMAQGLRVGSGLVSQQRGVPITGRERYPGFPTQLALVWKRMFVSYWRNPSYNFGRLAFHAFTGLLIGFSFYGLSDSVTDMTNRMFAIFMALLIGILQVNMIQPSYLQQREWFLRESSSGFYDWKAFALSIFSAELPYSTVGSTIFFCVTYWTINLNRVPERIGYFYLALVIYNWYTISLGQMVATVAPTVQAAAAMNPFFLSMLMQFCGVTMPYSSMPKFWSSWMYWIDPMHYFVEGILGNELHESRVTCAPNEVATFPAPPNVSCQTYIGPFAAKAPGKLLPSTHTRDGVEHCNYCLNEVGDEFLQGLGWDGTVTWRNLGILACFWVFNLMVVGILARKYRGGR